MPKILSIEEKLLKNLPPAEMAGRLMTLPAPRRLAALLEREDAEAVVAALPEPDFHLFVKELGADSAAPLLAMARPEQFTHLLDVDCWQGDELLAGKTLAWCEAMIAANEVKLLNWLYQVDFEFLVVFFKKWIDQVETIEDEDDYQEESDVLPRLTIDNQYYFSTRYPNHEPLLKYILGYLFENHHDFYLALLHQVRAGLDTETGELAYRFHRGRLADHAIPDLEEAVAIYHPLPAHRINRDKTILQPGEENATPPTFAMAVVRRRDLLGAALARINDPADQATLRQELAALANKVLIADRLDADDPANLQRAADKAAAMINLGLELFSGDDEAGGAETLRQVYLENLFRLGHHHLAALTGRMQGFIDNELPRCWPAGLNLVDEPWQERINLLTAKTPIIMRPQSNGPTEEDFVRSRADLERVERLIGLLTPLPALLAQCREQCREEWEQLAARLSRKGQIHNLNDITLGSLLFTGAANELWTGSFEISALPLPLWGDIAPLLAPEAMAKAITARLRTMLAGNVLLPDAEAYLQPLLDRYRQEMGHRTALPDPRMMPFLLFTEAAACR
ncbi:MAG: DUF6178 family protein [Desulfobulbaceae bacterium]|nr:DUF6178 family protein [Desulfobulbaceae bacterium]